MTEKYDHMRVGAGSSLLVAGAFSLVLALVAWVYWPGVDGPLLLDDRSSVLALEGLEGNPDLALDYVFGDASGLLGRSVSMATFVGERLWLGNSSATGKKVNIVLHLLNGALVTWLFALVLGYLGTPGHRLLAVALGAVWLVHPLLVSTVLYLVQRMAMLSTLFMLMSLIAYVHWRLRLLHGRASSLYFLLVPLFVVIGLLAKENAIVVIPILLLLEALVFRFRGASGKVIPWLRGGVSGLIVLGASGLAVALLVKLDSLSRSFGFRPFSLAERLLTQSRIMWDYVRQVLLPDISRMGIYHDDVIVSSGLFSPQSTVYAVLGWLLVVLASVVMLRYRLGQLLVFAGAWFLLGHSVESTVLPLELYFEHRNYFPSIGLVLGVGILLGTAARHWPQARAPLLGYVVVAALFLAFQTSVLVQVWASRPLLLFHHINGHPDSARANLDMAEQMARVGAIDSALDYSRKAYEVSTTERAGDRELRNIVLYCLARQPVPSEQIDLFGVEDGERPLSSISTLLMLARLVQDDKCPGLDQVYLADRLAQVYRVEDFRTRGSSNIYSNLAVLENALGRYDNAFAYADQFLAMAPGNTRALLMKLHFATALGRTGEAQKLVAQLRELELQGKLSTGERKTLDLYANN